MDEHAEHGSEGVSLLSEYVGIITDPAHLLAEVTLFAGESLVATLVAFVAVKVHDRRKHS